MKLYLRRILNLLLWLNVCLLGGTGALLYWRLPPGSRGGHGLSLFGLTRHEWGDFHAIIGLVFAVLILAHLWLAWKWLKNAAAGKRLWPVLTGLAVGLTIPLFFALVPIEQNPDREGGSALGEHAEYRGERQNVGDDSRPRNGQGWRGGQGPRDGSGNER